MGGVPLPRSLRHVAERAGGLILRALTLWQPWAWAVARAGKPVENRTWHPPPDVTHLAIHAGKTFDPHAAEDICDALGLGTLPLEARTHGAVVAVVRLAGCVHDAAELPEDLQFWWSGPHGLRLANVQPLEEPVPCRGAQGLWILPDNAHRLVLAQIDKGQTTGPELVR